MLRIFLPLLLLFGAAQAYVGPGAGFGLATSFLAVLNAVLIFLLSLLLWPFITLRRSILRSRLPHRPAAGRVVVLGLDGFSPEVARRLMAEGRLPNISRLAESGTLTELGTTCPGVSPVAWTSFQTGVNPGRHGIFDFLAPDRRR
ncbi:MAG: nucleotide pyrophosphatase, partial [Candidatus Fermentibacter daniensis]|nr:nucleotide pyrophosphatase [Candidatus Fermentibacter daniensis]